MYWLCLARKLLRYLASQVESMVKIEFQRMHELLNIPVFLRGTSGLPNEQTPSCSYNSPIHGFLKSSLHAIMQTVNAVQPAVIKPMIDGNHNIIASFAATVIWPLFFKDTNNRINECTFCNYMKQTHQ